MATLDLPPIEQRFLIQRASWQTYEALLDTLGQRTIRMTYDRGSLELMSPSNEHERFKRLIGRMLEILTLELNIPIRSQGSTTFRRQSADCGLEPDECYYIQHESQVRGRDEIDLEVDPPPDLAVEIEISSSRLDRMGVYAALGVPEVWRYDGTALRIFELGPEGPYKEQSSSRAFPYLPLSEVVRFLAERNDSHETAWARRFGAWVRDTLGAHQRAAE